MSKVAKGGRKVGPNVHKEMTRRAKSSKAHRGTVSSLFKNKK